MMRPNRQKRLARAPLIYVVAQLRFSAILAMKDFLPKIQDDLRHAGYPEFLEVAGRKIRFKIGAAETQEFEFEQAQWNFLDKDRTSGFVLYPDSIAYQTTSYETHDPFLQRFRRGLEIVDQYAKIGLMTRVGLRYIDLVSPERDDNLANYLHPQLMGFPIEKIDVKNPVVMTETEARTAVGQIRMRSVQSPGKIALPADLMPISVKIAILQNAESIGPNATLDFDHFTDFAEPVQFSVASVIDKLYGLHGTISTAFLSAVTKHALQRWE